MSDLQSAAADDDLAGEIDDEGGDDPAAVDEGADPPAPPWHYFAGNIAGGPAPYPGHLLVSRFPAGVLLVDKPAARAWILDFDAAGGLYRCRDDAGSPLDAAGRWRAAEGADWEVRAYDPTFAGDDPPGTDLNPPPAAAGGADYGQASA